MLRLIQVVLMVSGDVVDIRYGYRPGYRPGAKTI